MIFYRIPLFIILFTFIFENLPVSSTAFEETMDRPNKRKASTAFGDMRNFEDTNKIRRITEILAF